MADTTLVVRLPRNLAHAAPPRPPAGRVRADPGSQLPAVGSPPTARAAGLQIQRLAGPDRYATAAAISRASFAADTPIAFVADGTAFPDALSAGPLAAGRGGPILLTAPDWLPPATSDELGRLRPAEIVVLGGGGRVSGSVAARLVGIPPAASHPHQRADRYATSAAVSAAAFPSARRSPTWRPAHLSRCAERRRGRGPSGGPLLLTEPNAIPGQRAGRACPAGAATASCWSAQRRSATPWPGRRVRLRRDPSYAWWRRPLRDECVPRRRLPEGAPRRICRPAELPGRACRCRGGGPLEAPLLLVPGDHAGPRPRRAKRLMPSTPRPARRQPHGFRARHARKRVTLGDLAPLPVCRYDDVAAAHGAYGDWPHSLLDTIYRVASTYRPPGSRRLVHGRAERNHPFRSLVLATCRDEERASSLGRPIDIQSAFRSYATQQATFDYWVARVGYTQALRTSARRVTPSISWAPGSTSCRAARPILGSRTGRYAGRCAGCWPTPGATAS